MLEVCARPCGRNLMVARYNWSYSFLVLSLVLSALNFPDTYNKFICNVCCFHAG